MKYEELKGLYYKSRENKTLNIYEGEVNARLNGIGSYKLPLEIKNNIGKNQAFFVMTPYIGVLLEQIFENSYKNEKLFQNLPWFAQFNYIKDCINREIRRSNAIEGIYSTKKEIDNLIKQNEKKEKTKDNQRFKGIVNKYYTLYFENKNIKLDTCKDIRNLYDEIFLIDIKKTDHPDGGYFRENVVNVESITGMVIHEGIFPETKIIDYMERSLNILNDKNIPFLVRVAVFHFLFGYIHPFYDGNGRLGRFISSYLLKNKLGGLVATNISVTINQNKSKYYKAFENSENEKNKGDITPFIIAFLEIILNSCEQQEEYLKNKEYKLNYHKDILEKSLKNEIINKQNQRNYDAVYLLLQVELFNDDGIEITDIARYLKISEQTARLLIKKLSEKGYPIVTKKEDKKNKYSINIAEFEKFYEIETNV